MAYSGIAYFINENAAVEASGFVNVLSIVPFNVARLKD